MKKESVKNFFGKAREKLSGLIPENLKKKIPADFFSRFSKKQKIIAIVLAVAIVAGSVFGSIALFGGKEEGKGEVTAFAQMGSVSSVIEGSGTIEALQQYEITSLIKGEVVADYFEEGDQVEKDDILYEMDNEAGYEAIDNASSGVKKARRNYTNATEDIANLIVKSKSKGTVTNVYIEKGDTLGNNAKVADVIDNSSMILEIQFLEEYARQMIENVSSADVTLTKNGTVLSGKVTKISSGSVVSSVGSKVTNVEITVPNPGAIKEGDYATAQVGEFACSSEGSFKNAGKSTIYAKVSGTVEAVDIMVGDFVAYGQKVAILSNENITDIDETRDNYEEAQKKYDDAVEGLEDYVVKAPITGTIIQKNIKAGEKLESGNGTSVMAIIADLSSLVFEMSVDELDISKLSVGMDVEVKADAIENVTFGAKVTNISIVGTSNNGVTSYPVKITLNPKEQQQGAAQMNFDKLIPGLNVSASVVIEKAENVIVVPVSAVRRGNIVIVSEDSESEGITIEESIEASRSAFSVSRQGFSNNSASSDAQKKGGKKYSASSDAGSFENNAAGSDGKIRDGKFGKGNIPSDSSGFTWGNKKNSGSASINQKPSSAQAPKKADASSPSENTKKENSSKENSSKNKSSDNVSSNDNPAVERIKAMLEAVEVPEGYKAIIVETGLSDESFIEIKRGLSEGDKVLLPDVTSNVNSNQGMNGMPQMGGMPAMGGMGGMGGNRSFGGSNNRSGSTNRNFGSR